GYLLLGLVGAPIFAQFKGGPGALLSPTFGFVISFIFVSFLVGKSIGIWGHTKKAYALAGTFAIIVNYAIGTNYMYAALTLWADAPSGFGYLDAWSWMVAYLSLHIVVYLLCHVRFHLL